MWIAMSLMFIGVVLILISVLAIISIYLLIIGNIEATEHVSDFLSLGKTTFLYFILTVFCITASVSGILGGLALIDKGTKKMDSFEEVKK